MASQRRPWSAALKTVGILSAAATATLLSLYLATLLTIYLTYLAELEKYRYVAHCCREGNISCLWNFAKFLQGNFAFTYGALALRPQGLAHFFGYDVAGEVAFVLKTGACGVYAIALAKALKDLGCETRVVSVMGADHAFPEVLSRGEWYVFDATYTTPDKSVEARLWARHVAEAKRPFYNAVARLVVSRTGNGLTEEHGFNTTTLVIKVVVATTPRETTPAGGAIGEVYVPSERFYRSLVYEGVADKEGVVKLNVAGERGYIVIATLKPLFGLEYAGAESIYVPPEDEVINITLRVYPKGRHGIDTKIFIYKFRGMDLHACNLMGSSRVYVCNCLGPGKDTRR